MLRLESAIAVKQTTSTFGRLHTEILKALEEGKFKLQSMPGSLHGIMQAIQEKSSNARRVAEVAKTDLGLTHYILRMVNSPLYRGLQQIEDLEQAIGRLGIGRFQNLATTYSMHQLIESRRGAIRELLDDAWSHSTRVAAIACVLAQHTHQLDPNDALLDGLIHNIGVLPIVDHLTPSDEPSADFKTIENLARRLYAHAGVALLQHWDITDERLTVVSEHLSYMRDAGPRADRTDIVQVANLYAWHERGIDMTDLRWVDIPAFGKFGMPAADLLGMLPSLKVNYDEFQACLFRPSVDRS